VSRQWFNRVVIALRKFLQGHGEFGNKGNSYGHYPALLEVPRSRLFGYVTSALLGIGQQLPTNL
jgi:hypothetical protein